MLDPSGCTDAFPALGAKERKVILNNQSRCLPVGRYVQNTCECRGF